MVRKTTVIHRIVAVFFGLLSLLISSQAEKARADFLSFGSSPGQPQVLSQGDVGDCACGPCSIFNAFQFGGAPLTNLVAMLPGATQADKVRFLIATYGGKPSIVYRDEPRYLSNAGMWEDDLVPFINDWLKQSGAAPVAGEPLSQQRNETSHAHLRRVYSELSRSLAAGFPPIVNLQSYMETGTFFHRWRWLDGHFVTVVGVQGELEPDASKFCMWVADSQTGRILQVFIYADRHSSSTSLAGDPMERSGKMPLPQPQSSPYLTIESPKLEGILEGSAARSPRTICVIDYIVHR